MNTSSDTQHQRTSRRLRILALVGLILCPILVVIAVITGQWIIAAAMTFQTISCGLSYRQNKP